MDKSVEQVALERIAQSKYEILNSLRMAAIGIPLAAEPDPERLQRRLQAKAGLSRKEAEAVGAGIHALAQAPGDLALETVKERGPEAIYGNTIDFLSVSFLERGAAAARAVARVAFQDGRPQGTGFMVSDRLFVTNNHVIRSPQAARQFCLEFDYELDSTRQPKAVSRYALDPDALFVSDSVNGLDYTLIAVGNKVSGSRSLDHFGWCALSNANDKHALGEIANIVQHPDGRYKEVVLRENQLVARLDLVLHYVADTQPGASGSPVFNNEWQAIALHHWGGPWRQKVDPNGKELDLEVNEGIRISAIVDDLRSKLDDFSASRRRLVEELLAIGEAKALPVPVTPTDQRGASPTIGTDGSITWRVPIEISVRLPMLSPATADITPGPTPVVSVTEPDGSEAKVKPSPNYADRSGYKPRFIRGHVIALPRLSKAQKAIAAPNKQARPGDDPFELKYHHFSIVMNANRRLAFFTACNIDGATSKHVDRDTGHVTPLTADDPGLESLWAASEAVEGSETWYDDPRLEPEHYAGKDVYEKQIVPGHPDPRSMGRTLRMFQRGHLVRRMDPAWGSNRQALSADADTFHWTNCSPQVGFFNMGRASRSEPNSGGGKLWRAIENYVLRNAVADDTRATCFTGPVFRKNDRKFRDIKVPAEFWKIVVWQDEGELRSLAMLANQKPVIDVWPEAMDGREEFGDASELDKVEDFLSTVEHVEQATGLDFGDDVRDADINAGAESLRRIYLPQEIALRKPVGAKKRNLATTR